ncbi:MAG: SDR family NAD(P)-dependent oxidoreductase [Novosphingobium sp.]
MLEGKVIIVTGGARGIGAACVEIFAADGACVVFSDLSEENGCDTEVKIRASGGDVLFVQGNMAVETDVIRMVDAAISKYGRLDGAVNNAGVAMTGCPFHKLGTADWQRVIDINLTGVFMSMKFETRAMMLSGGGAIVNISSADGEIGRPDASDYNASKHGVLGLTKSASTEYRETRVRVNAVLPGLIFTPLVESLIDDPSFGPQFEPILKRHTIDRRGRPEDIAEACRWLLSDLSTFVNGAGLSVDGGYLAR